MLLQNCSIYGIITSKVALLRSDIAGSACTFALANVFENIAKKADCTAVQLGGLHKTAAEHSLR